MPKNNTNKTTAQRNGQRTERGASGQAAISSGSGRPEASAASVVADSLGAVAFHPKKGSEVFYWRQTIEGGEEYSEGMFIQLSEDLCKIHASMAAALTGNDIKPLYKYGLEQKMLVGYVMEAIQKMIPNDCKFNIEYTEDGHYVVVYNIVYAGNWWHVLEMGPTALRLWKKNRRLHDLFVDFVTAFRSRLGIDAWFDGDCGFDIDQLKEVAINQDEPEDAVPIYEAWNNYKTGDASWYEKRLRRKVKPTAANLLKRAARFKANAVVEVIKAGCKLMDRFNISSFNYDAYDVDENGYYLTVGNQFTIMYDLRDAFSQEYETYIDSLANEGIQEAIASVKIGIDTKSIDLSYLQEAKKYMEEVNAFFELVSKNFKEDE